MAKNTAVILTIQRLFAQTAQMPAPSSAIAQPITNGIGGMTSELQEHLVRIFGSPCNSERTSANRSPQSDPIQKPTSKLIASELVSLAAKRRSRSASTEESFPSSPSLGARDG